MTPCSREPPVEHFSSELIDKAVCAAAKCRGQSVREVRQMEQGRRMKVDGLRVVADLPLCTHRTESEIQVCQLDPFGQPCRASGVADSGQRMEIPASIVCRWMLDHLRVPFTIQTHEGVQQWHLASNQASHLLERFLCEKKYRRRVLRDVSELGVGQAGVERDDDAAGPPNGHQQFVVARRVPAKLCEPIAGLDSCSLQRARDRGHTTNVFWPSAPLLTGRNCESLR